MDQVVEYPLEAGGVVRVLVDRDQPARPVTRGWGDERPHRVATQASESFEAVVGTVRPAADALLAALTGLRTTPSEISVEFTLQLTAGAGLVVAQMGSSANFKVTLTWRPQTRDSDG